MTEKRKSVIFGTRGAIWIFLTTMRDRNTMAVWSASIKLFKLLQNKCMRGLEGQPGALHGACLNRFDGFSHFPYTRVSTLKDLP